MNEQPPYPPLPALDDNPYQGYHDRPHRTVQDCGAGEPHPDVTADSAPESTP